MQNGILETAIQALTDPGWSIHSNDADSAELQIPSRYDFIPESLKQFLLCVDSCISPNEKTWFVTNADFQGSSDSAFAWNEWETLSLESTNDIEEIAKIKVFWQSHIPIINSIQSHYSYVACCLEPDRFGKIIGGNEPDFEDFNELADSFDELLEQIVEFYTGKDTNRYLRYIL